MARRACENGRASGYPSPDQAGGLEEGNPLRLICQQKPGVVYSFPTHASFGEAVAEASERARGRPGAGGPEAGEVHTARRFYSGYIALHHRAGDITAGFGMVNGEASCGILRLSWSFASQSAVPQVDIRSQSRMEVLSLLTCAHHLEQHLDLPSSTRTRPK